MQIKKVIDYIVSWLSLYLDDSKQKGFVVGVSGGIDSSVVSHLAALTKKDVLLLEMPIHQPKDQVLRGRKHIENLKKQFPNVRSMQVDITSSFDQIIKDFKISESSYKVNLGLANVRSRLRMLTLYYYAGINNYIVCGTGNKVEDFGIGFFTKYGDGGVDISPIADLYKTQVYEIGRELKVLDEIILAPPTDGLWDEGHTDEDQIGASYPEIEWAMKQDQKGKSEQDFKGRQKEVFVIYKRLNKANSHKFNPIPVCKIPTEILD